MKGLILCGGKGTRMRPFTHSLPKQLIPVGNKPVIHFAIENMKKIGIREVGFVVSHSRELFASLLGTGEEWGMKFDYVIQPETLGIAHAVLCAEEFVGGEDFMLYLGDNLLQHGLEDVAAAYANGDNDSAIMVKEVPNPEIFGVAVIEGSKIISIQEKPKQPKSNTAVIGVYIFNKKVFDAARAIKPSARGELEITDTIMELINMGCKVTPCVVRGWWKDTGQKADMIDANRSVLDDIETDIKGDVDSASEVAGKVSIGEGAKIINSRISGPTIIGAGATIENATVGPYSSIADKATLKNCDIENSIVMEGASIRDLPRKIESSLIGREASVTGGSSLDLAIGDHCAVVLP